MKNYIEFFTGFQEGFKNFGHTISIIINSLLLSFVYCMGVGLTSIFAKILNKHFLDIKSSKNRDSYWLNLNLKKKSLSDYYRQF